jgi:hypothetical protein
MADPKTTKRLSALRELMEKKRVAKQKMLDERFTDVEQYEETEEEKFDRIMNDPSAWR